MKLANGNLMIGFCEVDMLGRVIRCWSGPEGATELPYLHHIPDEMPSGNVLWLGLEVRSISGYQTPEGEKSHNVVGDVVLELTPDDQVVNQWKILDIRDPHYYKTGFHTGFWDMHFPGAVGGTKDWSHGNSVEYSAVDDSLIVSLCKLDWVVKIDRLTGKLLWRLGENGDFALKGGGEWFSNQHAARLNQDGNIVLFDNGVNKALPRSRVVEYQIDTSSWEAIQVWEFLDDKPYYSPTQGDIDLLSNGNVLISDSARFMDPDLEYWDPKNQKWARVLEVTHTPDPEIVLEVIVKDESEVAPASYSIASSVRVTSLYPE